MLSYYVFGSFRFGKHIPDSESCQPDKEPAAAAGGRLHAVDAATRTEFAARLSAMRAYTGLSWTQVAKKFSPDHPDHKKRGDVMRKWSSLPGKDQPSDHEAQALAQVLAEESRSKGRHGLPAAFLWPIPEDWSVAHMPDEEVRRQLDAALRSLSAIRDSLPPEEAA